MNHFLNALLKKNDRPEPPVWFMRQAGRYHAHYQELRKKHSFLDLCKIPALAAETTWGPIQDFDFDAAILFSDLLFPLEALGMGLSYDPSPKLSWTFRNTNDVLKLNQGANLLDSLQFQAEAIKKIRTLLPAHKGLIGFVGGPLTLYSYASDHQLEEGFKQNLFEAFSERLIDLLAQNMALQASSGIDALALFDTSAGEVDPPLFKQRVIPVLQAVISRYEFYSKNNRVPLIYYSRGTSFEVWDSVINALPIQCLGVDWKTPLSKVALRYGDTVSFQGNLDPHSLLLTEAEFKTKTNEFFNDALSISKKYRKGWIFGLGHGVLPKTPESHVRWLVKKSREVFCE